jgi:hypothetical protein
VQRCEGPRCHDSEASPESRLVGCAIQSCPDEVQAASPLRCVTAADPPLMILHGDSDPLVPHNQGERLYMALNKACLDAVLSASVPRCGACPSWSEPSGAADCFDEADAGLVKRGSARAPQARTRARPSEAGDPPPLSDGPSA